MVSDIKKGNRGRFVAYGIDENFFDNLTQEGAWLLGLLAADGCVTDRGIFQFGQTNNKEIVEYVKNILSFEGQIYKSKGHHYSLLKSRGLSSLPPRIVKLATNVNADAGGGSFIHLKKDNKIIQTPGVTP
jgi:hypothetical protein